MSESSKSKVKLEVPRFLSVLRKVYRQRANKGVLAKEIRDVIYNSFEYGTEST